MIALFLLTLNLNAFNFNSTTYELDSKLEKKMFTSEIRTRTEGDFQITEGVTKDAKTGAVVLREVSKTREGELIEVKVEQLQTGDSGTVQIKDGSVHFEHSPKDGKKKTASEKIKKTPVIASTNLLMFVQRHWDKIQADKEMDVRMAVWDRAETVGFTIIADGEEETAYGKAIHLRVKPSSFIIAAFLKPLHLWFSTDGTKLLTMKGRIGAKIKKGDEWEATDAEVVYDWAVAAPVAGK